MTYLLASAARATVGARSGQEDAYRVWPSEGVVRPNGASGLLAVLADGMGGHRGGAIAGQTACESFTEAFAGADMPYEQRLDMALHASNDALAEGVKRNTGLKGMGCTLIGAWFDDAGMRWTSVGDSLLLLYRFPDVIRLNEDHSLGSYLDEQARRNEISYEEARGNRHRNALRSALTGAKIDLIDLRGEPLQLMAGDWILLASDGIGSLDGDELADIMYRYRESSAEEMAGGLIAAVDVKGIPEQDNTTVIAIRVEGASETAGAGAAAAGGSEEVTLRTRRIGVVSNRKMVTAAKARPGKSESKPPPPRSTLETLLTKGPIALLLAAGAAFVLAAAIFLLKASRNIAPEPTPGSNTPSQIEAPSRPDTGLQTQPEAPAERPPSRIVDPAPPAPPVAPPPPQAAPAPPASAPPAPAPQKMGPGPATGPDAAPGTRTGPPAKKSQSQSPSEAQQPETSADPANPSDPPSGETGAAPQPQQGGSPPRSSKRSERSGTSKDDQRAQIPKKKDGATRPAQ